MIGKAKVLFVSICAGFVVSSTAIDGANDRRAEAAAAVASQRIFDEPILWTGSLPDEAASNELLSALTRPAPGDGPDVSKRIERYLSGGPSGYAASLHAHLGKFYRDSGRYSLALQHWEEAWRLVSGEGDPNSIEIGDFLLAHWCRLLASLGRVDRLEEILTATLARPVNPGPLGQILLSTREAYGRMVHTPGIAFKCGVFALESVAKAANAPKLDSTWVKNLPSPREGFSAQELIDIAASFGFDLVAARRLGGAVPVPSVVHWKENHYAAVTARRGDLLRVSDPTFGYAVWLPEDTVVSEASGTFLMERKALSGEWRPLSPGEAEAVRGRGYPTAIDDNLDSQCRPKPGVCPACAPGHQRGGGAKRGGSPTAGGGGGSGGAGGAGSRGGGGTDDIVRSIGDPVNAFGGDYGCDLCGMPQWRVSEPFTTLWIEDIPLWYSPSHGPAVELQLAYKQRDTDPYPTGIFGLGARWRHNWVSWVDVNYADPTDVTLHAPGGGTRKYTADYGAGGETEFTSNTKLAVYMSGSSVDRYEVMYPDNSKDVYSWPSTNSAAPARLFLKEIVDSAGQKITLHYWSYVNTNGVLTNASVKLASVVDADGLSTRITYHSTYTNLISQVTDPFSRTTTFAYDGTGTLLTNITDVGGLSTGFLYEGSATRWITNMVTPYGVTAFRYTDLSMTNSFPAVPTNTVNRAVDVSLPGGGHHLYVYRDWDSTNSAPCYLPYDYTDPDQVPDVDGTPPVNNNHMNSANTWSWGPLQYSNITGGYTSSGSLADLSTTDYRLARMRHWNQGDSLGSALTVGRQLVLEREPSALGTVDGQMTWYSYADSDYCCPGTPEYPSAILRVVKDATAPSGRKTWYFITDRDSFGRITDTYETFGTAILGLSREYHYAYDRYHGFDLTSVTGPDGATIASYVYNEYHQATNAFDALTNKTEYYYNANRQLSGAVYPGGLVLTNYYFASGTNANRLDRSVLVGISTNSYTYTNGLVYTHTGALGAVTTYTWDALQRVTKKDVQGLGATTYGYYRLDLTNVTDALTNSVSYGYDANRNLTATTNEVGTVTRYGYCDCGALKYVTNAFGTAVQQIIQLSYDNAGNRTLDVYGDGYTVNRDFDALGRLSTWRDGLLSITNTYNLQSLVVAVSNAAGRVVSKAFDVYDRVTNSLDGNGITVTNAVDPLGRVVTASVGGSGTRTYRYGPFGPTNVIDELAFVTKNTFDSLGRLTRTVDPIAQTNSFTYDAAGDLLTLTDMQGVTTWSYDQYGRMTNKMDALGSNILAFRYDALSRATNRWSAAKGNTAYLYNGSGSVTNIVYPSSAPITYEYDALQRLKRMTDSAGASDFAYNAADQLTSEGGRWASDSVVYGYGTRLIGTRTISQPRAPGWVQTDTYDNARRLSGVSAPSGSFQYLYAGTQSASLRIQRLALPNGAYVTNTYDAATRVSGTYLKDSGNRVLDSRTYGYNDANYRKTMTNAASATNYWLYAYDAAGQLTNAIGREASGSSRLHEQFNYRYDSNGNLVIKTVNQLNQAFSINSLNQYGVGLRIGSGGITVAGTTSTNATSVTVNGTSASLYNDATFAAPGFAVTNGNNTYVAVATDAAGRTATNTLSANLVQVSCSYDANGNMTGDGLLGYGYDDENQLVRIVASNLWSVGFVYDGMMRLRIRTESNWVGSVWIKTNETRYIYDGKLVFQERDGNNVPLVTYTRGADLSASHSGAGGIGGLLARTENTTYVVDSPRSHSYYFSDANGNVADLVDERQVLAAKYSYDPYGNILAKTGRLAEANVYRFSSKEIIRHSGFYYYGFRFYNPNLQRWLNRDPLEEWADVNLYRFNYNAPTVYVDPDGENPAAIGIGIGIIGGGGGAGIGIGGAVGALGPGLAIGGAAGIGWGIGTWINDNTPVGNIGTAVGNWICPPISEARHESGQKNYVYRDVAERARREKKNPCDILDDMMDKASTSAEKLAIKVAQKAFGCRRSNK